MATTPVRESILSAAVTSIVTQVDHLFVYLDGHHEVPEALKHPDVAPKVSVVFREGRSHGAAGKFWWLGKIDAEYYFGVDDDVMYPFNYVQRMCKSIEKYNHPVIVGVHGIRFDPLLRAYFKKRTVWPFWRQTRLPRRVHALGTGTCVFQPQRFELRIEAFPNPFMVDLDLAVAAKRRNIPMICVSRPNRWLEPIKNVPGPTLYRQYKKDDAEHIRYMRANAPWPRLGLRRLFLW